MKVKLIAFSIVHIAPASFKTPYGVGIAEDDKGNRMLVRIDEEHLGDLKSGIEGEILNKKLGDRELSFFSPRFK